MPSTSRMPRLRLVGGMQIRSAEWTIEWFGSLFDRLGKEVPEAGEVIRYAGYEGLAGERCEVRFLGVDVDQIGAVPEGMVAWEMDGDTWTVLETRDGREVIVWQKKLAWAWSAVSSAGSVTGEFSAVCPSEWSSQGAPVRLDFRFAPNIYIAKNAPCDDDIHLVGYDPSWLQKYADMENRIRSLMGNSALRVEHYGSTSIPDIPAKPIVDILVEIPSFEEGRRVAIPAFNSPECEYCWYMDHMCFIIRERLMGKRVCHIHMAPAGHRLWAGLAFRDYLRTHPEDAARYAALKYELAGRHRTDREAYTNAKAEFVREINAKTGQQ